VKKSLTSSIPRSLGGKRGLIGRRDLWACSSDSKEGIDFPETDLEIGENSLRSSSMPRTTVSNI
jgi:hypothetical protein